MKNIWRQITLLTAAALIGAFGFQGCGGDDPVDPDPDPDPTDSTFAELLVVHGAADAPAVDILVDTGIVTSNLILGETTGDYAEVNDGARRVRITPVGDSANPLVDQSITLVEGKHYTAFAVTDANGDPSVLLFEDDLTAPAAGKAGIRLVHLIPDGPHARLGIPLSGTGPIVDSIDFMENANLFQQIDAGSTTFSVANADGGGGQGGIPRLIPNFTVTLEDGGLYSIVLIGKIDGGTARHIIVEHGH